MTRLCNGVNMDSLKNKSNSIHLAIAITGASGSIYGKRLVSVCREAGIHVHLIISEAGRKVYRLELGEEPEDLVSSTVQLYDYKDYGARIASGSFPLKGLVIIPCSMGTLGAIAHGISGNLIHRCADVCLKEGRRIILVPRETPLNRIHLNNMLHLAEAGATILPAMPGFYHNPKSIGDLVDFIVARVLSQLGIKQDLHEPWDGLI